MGRKNSNAGELVRRKKSKRQKREEREQQQLADVAAWMCTGEVRRGSVFMSQRPFDGLTIDKDGNVTWTS